MLHIDESLLELDLLVDDLVDELSNTEEAQNYRKRRDDFLKDPDLQEKLSLLNENFEWLKYRPELRDLRREINLNEKVYQLKIAENDLQEILSSITRSIAQGISKQVPINENSILKGGGHHHRRKSE